MFNRNVFPIVQKLCSKTAPISPQDDNTKMQQAFAATAFGEWRGQVDAETILGSPSYYRHSMCPDNSFWRPNVVELFPTTFL